MQRKAADQGRRHHAAARTDAGPVVIGLPGLQRRIALTRAAPLLPALEQVLNGWKPEETQGKPGTCVQGGRRGFRIGSDYLETPLSGLPLASAVCAVLADIAQSWAEERPDTLALHAGAVATPAGLVMLTGPARAGKSTLIARAGLEPGWQVFGDDVLPLGPDGHGHALGIQPRLRLPVPAPAGAAVQRLARDRCLLRDARYAYVSLPNLARHGQTAPLRAVIQLDRRSGTRAQLHDLPPVETLNLMMAQSINPNPAADARLIVLARRIRGIRLVFSDLEPAMDLLRDLLATPGALAALPLAPPLPADLAPPAAAPLNAGQMLRRLQRAPGIVARRLGNGMVLWGPELGVGLALNGPAAALWQLLDQPVNGADLAAALAAAFPDEPAGRIRADVALALGGLLSAGALVLQPE